MGMNVTAALLLLVLTAACGGTPATTGLAPTGDPLGPTLTAAPATDAPATDAPVVTDPPIASFTPGAIDFRVVNLREEGAAVDVYMRTQGLVEAFPVQAGLPYGAATDYFTPPDPGTVVITPAGAGDPTCVGTCPHIISSSSTGFGEGDARTIVLYDEGAQELWHNPDPETVGMSGNALPPADSSVALVFTVAVGLTNADFGLRLAVAGEEGCQLNRASENVLVGGNQVGVFSFEGGSASVNLHDNSDQECTGEPVGGPFEVTGPAGSRTLLVLYGEPGGMSALTLEV